MGLNIKSTSAATTSAKTNGTRGSGTTEIFSLDKLSGGRSPATAGAKGTSASVQKDSTQAARKPADDASAARRGANESARDSKKAKTPSAANGESGSPPAGAQSTPAKNLRTPANRAPAPAQSTPATEPAAPGNSVAASLAADTQITSSSARGVGKGRSPSRDVPATTYATADEPIKGTSVGSGSGVADEHLLQLAGLASDQGTAAADSRPAGSGSSEPAAPAASDSAQSPADGSSNTPPDAVTVALASQVLASQALAAAFGNPVAAQTPAPSNKAVADSNVTGIAGPDSGGSPMQNLVALLVEAAAGPKGKEAEVAGATTPAAPTSAADAKSAGNDSSVTGDATAPWPSGITSLAHLGFASHIVRSESTPPTELRSSVGTPAWNDELGNQLTWMSQQGVDSASLRLSPEHLGPLEVRISVQNGAASVWFGASQADTRAALERALPHLRQMFANQGLTLTDSGVSREPPRQSKAAASQGIAAVAAVSGAEAASPATRLSLGLVDTYV